MLCFCPLVLLVLAIETFLVHAIGKRADHGPLSEQQAYTEVFELVARTEANLESAVVEQLRRYEEALRAFENGDLALAEQILSKAAADDVPAQWLISAMTTSPSSESNFDATLDLDSA